MGSLPFPHDNPPVCPNLWRLIIHDWTKFLPSEWNAYADYFYGNLQGKEELEAFRIYGNAELAPHGFYVKDRFNVAWLLHQRRNKHHWQYWLLTEDGGCVFPLQMPEKYAREMVADWMGAGRAITGKWKDGDIYEVQRWYAKNCDKIILHTNTRRLVESLLHY